jgi:hypothetical protein
MEITFTKQTERDYQVFVRRDDGVLLQVRSFDRPRRLPHDIAHFVVENELQLDHGFWGLLAAGVMFSNTRVVAGRVRKEAAERSGSFLKRVGQEPIEAEVLVSVMLDIAEERAETEWWMVKAKLDAAWKPRRSQLQHPICHNDVRRVCRELRIVEQQWRALSVGKSITVRWIAHNNPRLQRARR